MSLGLIRNALSSLWLAAVLLCAGWPLSSQTPPVPPPPPSTTPPGEFTISDTVQLVLLDVSVRDAAGGFVSGLPKSAFTVLEDGKPQPITQFANQDVPVCIGLIIDNSGSMRPKKPEVITSALILIQASNPEDEVFVINFNDRVRRGLPDIIPFTDDIKLLRAALTRTDPEGRTSLYDAILAGLKQLELGRRAKKALVVVSDGGDNASTHSFKETEKAVLQSRATIYTIGVFNAEDRDRNPEVLRKLAHITGGECYLPKELSEVATISRQIAKDIRTRYSIGYNPPDPNKPGVRHIKVEVKSPDHEKLIARTRTSYDIPSPTQTTDRRAPAEAK
jgi:Ca-activated chloride channel family protein